MEQESAGEKNYLTTHEAKINEYYALLTRFTDKSGSNCKQKVADEIEGWRKIWTRSIDKKQALARGLRQMKEELDVQKSTKTNYISSKRRWRL